MILKEILDFQGNPGLQKGPSCDMSANTKKQKIEGFQGTPNRTSPHTTYPVIAQLFVPAHACMKMKSV